MFKKRYIRYKKKKLQFLMARIRKIMREERRKIKPEDIGKLSVFKPIQFTPEEDAEFERVFGCLKKPPRPPQEPMIFKKYSSETGKP